jgi:hypothetical protein
VEFCASKKHHYSRLTNHTASAHIYVSKVSKTSRISLLTSTATSLNLSNQMEVQIKEAEKTKRKDRLP